METPKSVASKPTPWQNPIESSTISRNPELIGGGLPTQKLVASNQLIYTFLAIILYTGDMTVQREEQRSVTASDKREDKDR